MCLRPLIKIRFEVTWRFHLPFVLLFMISIKHRVVFVLKTHSISYYTDLTMV